MRLLKNRVHYWNCSKFANWIRGEDKPYALEWGEWSRWHLEQKQKRPFRYWLSDTFLSKLQNVVYFPSDVYYAVKTYIRNRYIDKIQYLHTGLKPGEYYDFDHRLIHALFNELVDFVEKELSYLSKWDRNKQYKFKNGRCVEAAYDYFKSVEDNFDEVRTMVLKEPKTSALFAQRMGMLDAARRDLNTSKKIKKLYEWWTIIRPNRVSPYSDNSLGDIDDILDTKKTKVNILRIQKSIDIEEEHNKEDTKMLIELIKIRGSLWT